MMNLAKFSRMSFTEITSLPNYYIHEIYKLFVEDSNARAKKEAEEAAKRDAEQKKIEEQQKKQANASYAIKDSSDVANLRSMLGGLGGLQGDDLEELIEELE